MLLKPIISAFAKNHHKYQVEFYLIDAFEIYHYLTIYNELLSSGIKTRTNIIARLTNDNYKECRKLIREYLPKEN
jgi:hypothetical protein